MSLGEGYGSTLIHEKTIEEFYYTLTIREKYSSIMQTVALKGTEVSKKTAVTETTNFKKNVF